MAEPLPGQPMRHANKPKYVKDVSRYGVTGGFLSLSGTQVGLDNTRP